MSAPMKRGLFLVRVPLASHAIVFRTVVLQTPLKTTAWEAQVRYVVSIGYNRIFSDIISSK